MSTPFTMVQLNWIDTLTGQCRDKPSYPMSFLSQCEGKYGASPLSQRECTITDLKPNYNIHLLLAAEMTQVCR